MKKTIIAFFLIFTVVLTLCACAQEINDASSERAENEKQPSQTAPEQNDEKTNEWSQAHFEAFGIDDMEEMPFIEITSYDYNSEKEITVIWEETTDFDAVTGYAEDLFNKTAAANGGNYVATVEDDKWALDLDHELTSFQDACTSWENLDYYCAIWTYSYNGKVIDITIHGEVGDEEYDIEGFTRLSIRMLG